MWALHGDVQSNPTRGAFKYFSCSVLEMCQSVIWAALPSHIALSGVAGAKPLGGQRFANVSAQRHTFHVSGPLSFPTSPDTASLTIHFGVPDNYPAPETAAVRGFRVAGLSFSKI